MNTDSYLLLRDSILLTLFLENCLIFTELNRFIFDTKYLPDKETFRRMLVFLFLRDGFLVGMAGAGRVGRI